MNRAEALKQGLSLFLPQPKKPTGHGFPAIPHQDVIVPQAALDPYLGWTEDDVIHLLKRAMFGAKKADVAWFLANFTNVSDAVDSLLTIPATATPLPLKFSATNNSALVATHPYVTTAVGATWTTGYSSDSGTELYVSLMAWMMERMIFQDRTVVEKMVMFLHNLLPTSWNTYSNGYLSYRYTALLRQYALGNYKNLIADMTKDGVMMEYLNNNVNTKTAPNENYARELQELFTIGLTADAPGSYTNLNDVKGAAKVLTGHSYNVGTGNYVYYQSNHDTTSKVFSAFYNGNTIVGGQNSTTGPAELGNLLTMIFNKDETAHHIVEKLYRFFVYYKIDATVDANVITPLATALKQNGYNLGPILGTLLKSQHFYDVASRGCFIKTPLDLYIGGIREYGLQFPDPNTNLKDYYDALYRVANDLCGPAGQQPLFPPDVAGWKAYYQSPSFHELWINTSTVQSRDKYLAKFIDGISMSDPISPYAALTGSPFKVDVIAYASTMPNPSDPDALVSDFIKYLFRNPVDPAIQASLKTANLLGGQVSNYYWTNAWNAYIAAPTTANVNIVRPRLQTLLKQLMKMAEYHLA